MPKNPSAAPHPLLAGLGIGLLLFGFTLCTVGMLAMPALTRLLNIGANSGQTWTPPTPAPTPAAVEQPTDLPTSPPPAVSYPTPTGPLTFQVGNIAVNVNDGAVNLRKTPGYQNKPASDRIALVPANERVNIIGGPALMDGLTWWNVEWQGQQGWIAETRASGGRILAPAAPP